MIINSVITSGGTQPSGKYALLDRVKDDSNNDIGCVVGFHTDSNNTEYAVVCLNKIYRSTNTFAITPSSLSTVVDLPVYVGGDLFTAPETATFNCDKILTAATSSGMTSAAIGECRNHSFVIDGVTYYGQIPTVAEIVSIMQNKTAVNSNDPSLSGPDISGTTTYWASTISETGQYGCNIWRTGAFTPFTNAGSNIAYNLIPILELPN